ncbi:MAG: isoprenylcysteine carboxylmethyltransferase family protein [Planctomycetaceae bacterium]|nr:isoprenylcysteine carboxylmethyltransferase family protein [Planctomycetaceae bacterium]
MSAPAPTVSSPSQSLAGGRLIWEITCNVVLSLLFLQFAMEQGRAVTADFRLSTLLLLAKVSTDVVFYLIRRLPKETSFSLYDWLVGIAGTYAIVFFRPDTTGHDLLVGQALQFAGLGLQVLAMLSLNRSIGMVPANRGIQTGGLYRWIRHPLYCSYVVAFLGYVINHPSAYNIGVYAVAVALWVLRLRAEERFLLQDPAYREFAARIRWRLVPGVF